MFGLIGLGIEEYNKEYQYLYYESIKSRCNSFLCFNRPE